MTRKKVNIFLRTIILLVIKVISFFQKKVVLAKSNKINLIRLLKLKLYTNFDRDRLKTIGQKL